MKVFAYKKKKEKGQSLVEFAVSVVILLLLLSGIVDLGRLFFQYIAMRDAAQEGATYGIIDPSEWNGIAKRVAVLLTDDTNMEVDIALRNVDTNAAETCFCNLSSNPPCSCSVPSTSVACGGNEITVTVRNPSFQISMPFLGALLGGQSINVETSIHGTILRPKCK